MPIAATLGVTTMPNGDIDAAINEGAGAAGDTFRVEIRDTQGAVVNTLHFSTEPVAIERAAEIIAPQYGYSAIVWGRHITLASNSPEP